MQGNSKMLPKLVFLLRQQQSKIKEICSFLDFLHFDVLGLSLSPSPEVGVLEAIYEMKRVIVTQQWKLDMLSAKREKAKAQRENKKTEAPRFVYWLIITLLLLVSLKVIYLLPSHSVITLTSQLEFNLKQEETINSQGEMILFLQNELRETREFYFWLSKIVFGIVSIGVAIGAYILSGLKKKIQYQEKLIIDQTYEGLIARSSNLNRVEAKENYSLLLFGITFFVVVAEMYMVIKLF